MAVLSYSFHISNGSNAVSNGGKLARVGKHNLRGYANGSNLGYDQGEIEILVGGSDLVADFKQAYHEEFDAALQEYNKGKRSDRQINDYFDKVSADTKKDLAVEAILQIGDKDYWGERKVSGRFTYEDTHRMDYVFRSQIKTLQARCPDFKIVSAVAHYDESSPHLHIVGIPIGRDYKRGMSKQVAKTKVFTPETLRDLQESMRQAMLIQMQQAGFDVQLRTKQQGRNRDYEKGALQGLNKAIEDKQHTLSEVTLETMKAQTEAFKTNNKLNSLKSDIAKGQAQLEELGDRKQEVSEELSEARNELKGIETRIEELKRQEEACRVQRDSYMRTNEGLYNDYQELKTDIAELERKNNTLQRSVESLEARQQGALAIIQEAEDTKAMFEDLLDCYNEREVSAAKEECDEIYNEIRPRMLPDEQRAYQQEDFDTLQRYYDERSMGDNRYIGASALARAGIELHEPKQTAFYQPKQEQRGVHFFNRFWELLERVKDYIAAKKKPTLEQLREAYLDSRTDREAPIRNNDEWSL